MLLYLRGCSIRLKEVKGFLCVVRYAESDRLIISRGHIQHIFKATFRLPVTQNLSLTTRAITIPQ